METRCCCGNTGVDQEPSVCAPRAMLENPPVTCADPLLRTRALTAAGQGGSTLRAAVGRAGRCRARPRAGRAPIVVGLAAARSSHASLLLGEHVRASVNSAWFTAASAGVDRVARSMRSSEKDGCPKVGSHASLA